MKKTILIFGAMVFSIQQAHAVHQLIFRDASALTTGTVSNLLLDNSSVTKMGNLNDKFLEIGVATGSLVPIIANSTSTLGRSQRIYDLYAGAPGTPDKVDTIVGGAASFDAMLATAPINARGLTTGTSVQATIFISSGIYDVCGGTIPQGIHLWATAGSSTVFRPTSDTCRILTVYGSIHNITFDMQGRTRAGEMIAVSTGGVVDGVTINNADAGNQLAGTQYHGFMVNSATNVTIAGTFNSFAGAQQDNSAGGLVTIINSTNVFINLRTRGGRFDTNGKQNIYLARSVNVRIDGDYQEMGGRFVLEDGGNRDIFIGGRHSITRPYLSYIVVKPTSFGAISTGTFITGTYNSSIAGATAIVDLQDNGVGSELNGVRVTGCTAVASGGVAGPAEFAIVRSGTVRSIFTNNSAYGMPFISDAGNQTQYQTLGNFKDGVQQ